MPEALDDKKIADFRQRICDVATRQFTEQGIDKVSMRSLARELGYSATALYSYFRNKEEILAATRAIALERLVDRLKDTPSEDIGPADQLLALGAAWLAFSRNESWAYQLIFAPGQSPSAPLEEGMQQIRRQFSRSFEKLLAEREIPADPGSMAGAFIATMHGAISLQSAGKLGLSPRNFDEFYRLSLKLLLSGTTQELTGAASKKASQQFSLDL